MTTPIDTVLAALRAFQPGGLTFPEALLVAAYNALGLDPMTCPSNSPLAKPFDSSARDDMETFQQAAKGIGNSGIGNPRFAAAVTRALASGVSPHEGVELWLASTALATAAAMYAQGCEDLDT